MEQTIVVEAVPVEWNVDFKLQFFHLESETSQKFNHL